jgi:hypothetical protein
MEFLLSEHLVTCHTKGPRMVPARDLRGRQLEGYVDDEQSIPQVVVVRMKQGLPLTCQKDGESPHVL